MKLKNFMYTKRIISNEKNWKENPWTSTAPNLPNTNLVTTSFFFSWTPLVIKLLLPLSRFMISSYSLDEVHVWIDWMLWSINEDDQLIYLEHNQIWCHNSRIYGFLRELSVLYGVFRWWICRDGGIIVGLDYG